MLAKEKEYLDNLRKYVKFDVDDNHLRKKLVGSYFSTYEGVPYLSAVIEVMKDGAKVSANNLIAFTQDALTDKDNKQNLTQEEYYALATIPATVSCSGEPAVARTALKQLELVKMISDPSLQKKAFFTICDTVLNYWDNVNVQKKIQKVWEKNKLGDVSEIEDLIPALSNKHEVIEAEEHQVTFVKFNGNTLAACLDKVSQQKIMLDLFGEVVRAFKKFEPNHILFDKTDKNTNSATLYFNGNEKVKEFKELVNVCLSDVKTIVEQPAIEIYKKAIDSYPKIKMKNELDNTLSGNESKSKKMKI